MAFLRTQISGKATATAIYSNVQNSYTSNVVAGHVLVARCYLGSAAVSVSSITDSQGNTWLIGKRGTYTVGSESAELWYTVAGSSAACTVTMTPTSAVDKSLTLVEYSGNATTSLLSDAYSADSGGTTVTGNVAVSNCLGIGMAISSGGSVSITTASWVSDETPSDAWYSRMGHILDLGAAGSKTMTYDQAGAGIFIALKPSAASSAPTLTTVSPASGLQGQAVSITLTGTGFTGGSASVAVSGTLVAVSAVSVVSDVSITCTFTIDAAAATTGRNVAVTTTAGTSGNQTFTVNSSVGAPTLASVSPSSGYLNTTQPITLTGTYLSGATPSLTISGTGVTYTSLVQVNSTTMTANLVIASNATVSTRTISATTADGTTGTVNFTVKDPATSGTVYGGISPQGSPYIQVIQESDVFTIDDTVRIYAVTSSPASGALTAATGTPTYAVFEEGTATPILTGNMTQIGGSYTYLYSVAVTASTANGFEYGKQYAFLVLGTVAAVACGGMMQFKIDYKPLDMSTQAATNFQTFFDANNTASTVKVTDIASMTAAGLLNTVSTSYTTAGTVGEKFNRIDALVTSRTSTADIPTPTAVATQVIASSVTTPIKADAVKVAGVTLTGNGTSIPVGA